MMDTVPGKYIELKKLIVGMGKVMVAFSGGVDSALLLKAAVESLGENAVAVTAVSVIRHKNEFKKAGEIASKLKVEHLVVESDEMSVPEVRGNDRERCFYCKKNIFAKILELAGERGIKEVLEASTRDDLSSYRPGRKALEEMGIRSPLCEVGFSKNEVREALKGSGLGVWDAPSESCLLTRFPYGRKINTAELNRVSKAEETLREIGFSAVRVRTYDDMARIEVAPDEIKELLSDGKKEKVIEALKGLGYKKITVDMEGFRSGSMDL